MGVHSYCQIKSGMRHLLLQHLLTLHIWTQEMLKCEGNADSWVKHVEENQQAI